MTVISDIEGILKALMPSKERDVNLIHAHRLGRTRFFGIVTGRAYSVALRIASTHGSHLWEYTLRKYKIPITPEFADSREANRFLDEYVESLNYIAARGFTPHRVGRLEKWNPYIAPMGFNDRHAQFLQTLESLEESVH